MTRDEAHRMASEFRRRSRVAPGLVPASREVAIERLEVNGVIPKGFISVHSLGRWERARQGARSSQRGDIQAGSVK